ncbi:5'-deoxynucleotidase YfbR [Aquicella siphonis]|uniref:5'-deoxynucleotidase YfbR n=1 Tax=Aquicella siphonis TaxID=254247 RepID=A0A5E4PH66_9COXI|nr:HD domain-containing protein [Aquicella siphonis]VVC75858.1 5'-deoxynucleotidase YfbR [Aquicella siphonis]
MTQELLLQPPLTSFSARMQQQIQFILELDKLKHVMRRSMLLDQSRTENDAEHSWHLCMLAIVFAELAGPDVNIARVIRMLLIHDIVEIDAGDTFIYEESPHAANQNMRENLAAQRIFGLLPDDLRDELWNLWREFEEKNTPDAKFAASLDRIQPLFLNYFNQGGTWARYGVSSAQVKDKQRFIADASQPLWEMVETLIADAVERGMLKT